MSQDIINKLRYYGSKELLSFKFKLETRRSFCECVRYDVVWIPASFGGDIGGSDGHKKAKEVTGFV